MELSIAALAVTGSVCLLSALLLAWCLSAVRHLRAPLALRVFRNGGYLLKSHIDFLMMTGLLFATYLMFAHFGLRPAAWIVAALCIGSLLNPAGFLALALRPELPQTPRSPFGALMALSFVLTTAGYGAAAWLIAAAALRGS